MNRILFFIAFVLPLSLLAQQPDKDYKIFDTKLNKIINLDDLIERFKQVDVLFFGEEHNDSITHKLESLVLEKSYAANPSITLSLEMFENDVQLVLDEYLKGLIREKNFITEARAWPNYSKDYKPMVEFAKDKNIHIIAANTPARYTNMVSRGGLQSLGYLDKSAKKYLPPLPIDTASGKYYANFVETMGGHIAAIGFIYQSQNLWDASMAYHIAAYLKAHKNQKVLHINGRFHTDEQLGIMAQLKKYGPKLVSLNISSFSDENFNDPDWNEYKELGDFIIVTKPNPAKKN